MRFNLLFPDIPLKAKPSLRRQPMTPRRGVNTFEKSMQIVKVPHRLNQQQSAKVPEYIGLSLACLACDGKAGSG